MLFAKGRFLFICKFTSGAIMIVQGVTQYSSWQSNLIFAKMCMQYSNPPYHKYRKLEAFERTIF